MSFFIGIAACCVAAVFFGSMFVAIRRVDAGDASFSYVPASDKYLRRDKYRISTFNEYVYLPSQHEHLGLFSQWIISTAILCVGFANFCYQGFSGFYPLAMLGGVCWTVGNSTAIPLIRRLGLGLGLLIWSSSKCITGWVTGRFGLLGMKPNPPASSVLNYVGVALVILGGAVFSMIRVDRNSQVKRKSVDGLRSDRSGLSSDREKSSACETTSSEHLSESNGSSDRDGKCSVGTIEKSICIVVSILAGILYGLTFVPVIYMIDNPDRYPNHPSEGLSYVFSHFFGIFLTATAIFIVYAMYKRNKPYVSASLVLPSFLAGLLWATAQTAFFVANQHLSQAISFPIITALPGCVASLWGILYFHEIKGQRNLLLFSIALSLSVSGAVLVGMSKEIHL